MTIKKNWVLAVMAGVLVPSLLWAAKTQFDSSPSTIINCESGGGCQITIAGNTASVVSEPVEEPEVNFGSSADVTTNWTAGNFTGDLRVGGFFGVSGTTAFGGNTSFAGTVADSVGPIVGTVSSTFSSSATSTVCAVQNTSGRTRAVLDINVVVPETNSTGTVRFTAGTSTTAFASTTNALIVGVDLTQGWRAVLNPTSTVQTFTVPWNTNEWMVFKSSSTTNVGGGTCRVDYY